MFGFRIHEEFKSDVEPHEILLDSLAKRKEQELGISEQKFEVPLLKRILQTFFVFCFLLFLVLFSKTFQLQVIEGEKFSALAKENKFIIQQIQAERGVIYDKNLKQLVYNQPSFDLVLDKNKLSQESSEKEKILNEVSLILKKDSEVLRKEIEENEGNNLVVAENLSHEELILLEAKINTLAGFRVNNNPIRYYQDGENFSHLIGYTNKIRAEELKESSEIYSIFDYIGRDGVEKSYEEVLRRNAGKLQIESDAQGNIISKKVIQSPESGKSLVLWLDSDLQKKIEEELEKELQIIGAKKGVAVALDPKTGGVLALVSLPSFDNNLFQKGANQEKLQRLLQDTQKLQPLFNRVISGKYLTGSTIKPLVASAALEENIISADKKINDSLGYIVIQNREATASTTKKDNAIHGLTDMRKAIAESCNVYFYTIGGGFGSQKGLGPTKIKEYLELFGWNSKTGIDLPGEATGFLPDKEWKKKTFPEDAGWWDGDTYNFSIGQGFLQITPLEVVSSFSAIANGGKLLQPQVVRKIVDTSAGSVQVIEELKPEIVRENFISPQNLQIVREGMRQAVTGANSPQASVVDLNSLPVAAAAKTGTAELGNDAYNNWITVFAPYENPEIVLTIMLENVKGVQRAAVPIAKNVLEWYFSK